MNNNEAVNFEEEFKETSSEVSDFIKNNFDMAKLEVPICRMLRGKAEMEWFEFAAEFKDEKDFVLFMNDFAEIFERGIPIEKLKKEIECGKSISNACNALLGYADDELSDTVAESVDRYKQSNISFISEYINEQVNNEQVNNLQCADELIQSAVKVRDALLGYKKRISTLESNFNAQKKLLEIQRSHIAEQDNIILSQNATIEKYEKKFSYMEEQYKKLSRNITELNSFQDGIASIGENL